MTHTPAPIEDEFLASIGKLIAQEATPAMRRDLADAFILMTSMSSAAPYQIIEPTEMENHNEDPV